MGFPTKSDHVEGFWGYHHLRKHPYIPGSNLSSVLPPKEGLLAKTRVIWIPGTLHMIAWNLLLSLKFMRKGAVS